MKKKTYISNKKCAKEKKKSVLRESVGPKKNH